MKGWLLYLIIGILTVILESTLLAWPLTLVLVWWVRDADEKWVMALLVIWGVVLDILMVRLTGISAVSLLLFWAGLKILNNYLGGVIYAQIVYLVLTTVLWMKFLGAGGGVANYLVMEVILLGVIVASRQLMFKKEITLR